MNPELQVCSQCRCHLTPDNTAFAVDDEVLGVVTSCRSCTEPPTVDFGRIRSPKVGDCVEPIANRGPSLPRQVVIRRAQRLHNGEPQYAMDTGEVFGAGEFRFVRSATRLDRWLRIVQWLRRRYQSPNGRLLISGPGGMPSTYSRICMAINERYRDCVAG